MEITATEKKVIQRNGSRNDLLKLLAILTMVVDHIGYMYFPNETLFRIIGRLAFPIFAYQIAIGYSMTSNLKKYTWRLFVFALIAQIPYSFFSPDMEFSFIHYNVLFTFLAAIGMLYAYDMGILKLKSFIKGKNFFHLLCGILLSALTAAVIVLPEVLSFIIKGFYIEYGLLGLAMILLFHIFEKRAAASMLSVVILYMLHGYYRVALWNSAYSSALFWSNLFSYKYVWSQLDLQNGFAQLERYYFNAWGVLALIPIFSLKKINTSWIRLNKYIGYVFYPAHMAILIVIAMILK